MIMILVGGADAVMGISFFAQGNLSAELLYIKKQGQSAEICQQ
jgi:hypothetical protein